MKDNDVIITTRVWIPWAKRWRGEEYGYREIISARKAEEMLRPLPRDREINPMQAGETMRLLHMRKLIIDQIAAHVATALVHAIAEQDTENGYTKEELRGTT